MSQLFIKCMNNRVTCFDNNYQCHICDCVVSGDNIHKHFVAEEHQAKLDQICKIQRKKQSASLKGLSKHELRKIVENAVVFQKKSLLLTCCVCNCTISGLSNTLQHIDGACHVKQLLNHAVEQKNNFGAKSDKVQETVLQNSNYYEFTKVDYCQLCCISFANNTIAQYHVMLHLINELELLNEFDIIECKFAENESLALKCLLCNFSSMTSMLEAHRILENHFTSEIHLKRLKFFNVTKTEPGYTDEQPSSLDFKKLKFNARLSPLLLCNACDVLVPLSKGIVDEHVMGKNHQRKCQNNISDVIIQTNGRCDTANSNYYKCFMCDKSFISVSFIIEHYKTAEHKWKIKGLRMIEQCSCTNFDESNDIIICSLCNATMYTLKSLIDHVSGKKHNKLLETSLCKQQDSVSSLKLVSASANPKLRMKKEVNFEASITELINFGFSKENIQPIFPLESNRIEGLIDDLVSLNFSDPQKKRLPSLAKSPSISKVNSQSSSSSKSISLYGEQYIKFCIDLGIENIYNVDNEQRSLFQLGTSLTFPYQTSRACLACGQRFPNNAHSLLEHLKNLQHSRDINKLQLDHQAFQNFPDQFSDFRLGKLYMQDHLSGTIWCYCCNLKLRNKDKVIKEHAEDFVHIEKSKLWNQQSAQLLDECLKTCQDIWYYAEVFFCEICEKRCELEIDFVKHLIDPEHAKKVEQFRCRGVALTYHLCPTCVTYWFGHTLSYEIHCKSDLHKRFAQNKDFMVPDLTSAATQYLNDIDKNADLLEYHSNKVNLQKDEETVLLKALLETVKPVYPNAKGYIFGLRLSHLGFPKSDVDVFLDCENMHYASSVQERSQRYVKSVANYLKRAPKIWIVEQGLLTAGAPILKLRHIPTSLKCDISFTNGLTVEKSKLVGIYNVAFPICRKLILFLNKWLTLCRLLGPDCMTTFAISWCVIFYLQQKGFLPSVFKLIKRRNRSKIIDGWQCGFVEKFTAQNSSLTFKQHLKGFFRYYSNFDYQRSVMCPYLGEIIDKHDLTCPAKLPTEMDIYKKRLNSIDAEIFSFDSPMCIQDPIDLSQNITTATKKRQLRCFRQYCAWSAEKC